MALLKAFTTDSGITLSYWKITGFDIDNMKKEARIIVSPFVDQSARLSGASPVDAYKKNLFIRNFDYRDTPYSEKTNLEFDDHFSAEVLEQYSSNIYEYLYNYIKTLPDFEGAEDV